MKKSAVSIALLMLVLSLFLNGCAVFKTAAPDANARIVADLESRARTIRSYALDQTIMGKVAKRMYFQFERDGKPFFRFRSDFIRSGKRYVYIYNADGSHDYHYFPDERIAYRCPTDGRWNADNYGKAREAHFNYQGAVVDGEDVVEGRACYVLKFRNHWLAVWKEKGIALAAMNLPDNKEDAVYYENIEFDLPDDRFAVPAGVTIIDRKDGFFE
ncbi:MAG: hypothetical protein C4518_05905 [Desulfobacteraceae bacterium]|nr:MAG: hypothetical protein C4518_05905 [Desulfobacteraceae bacterium]